jgi:hypothetical protein
MATRQDALEGIPDDELVFVVRGSHPAAPETLRTFAQQVLKIERYSRLSSEESRAEARRIADETFALADRMEQHQVHERVREEERLAGLTANTDNEQLERKYARTVALASDGSVIGLT